MRALRALMIAAAVVAATGSPCSAEPSSVAQACPGYRARVEEASLRLALGDRGGAIAALRSAQDELASCLREQGHDTALATLLGRHSSPATAGPRV